MKTAIALGTFDGIHIAHRRVLSIGDGYKKIAVTFLKPPKMYFTNQDELIMDYEAKVKALEKMGFCDVVALDFLKVKDTPPKEFLDFLIAEYNPSLISCGFNYHFGNNGEGDTALLKEYCKNFGIEYRICDEIDVDGMAVSSTYIRNLLKNGEIDKANSLLFEPFSFSATVEHGDSRGHTIGFPTLNQYYPENLVKVKFGVYKTEVTVNDKVYDSITNIGIRPTFKSERIISETYVKNFSGDLYGKNVKVTLKEFLREEIKFASLEDLKRQIEIDKTK